ncbi:MAG: hypothetical protein HC831_11855 [Chloroflexia bacterium]|nr:hypothetical protein [Chloroflexia bacterium]
MKTYFFIAFIFFYHIAISQNYTVGHVLDLDGKTHNGSIDYKQWKKNPVSILFKSETGDVISYRAADLKSFSVGNDYYVSRVVTIDKMPVEAHKLAEFVVDSSKVDTLFLLTLVEGKVSLFSLVDDIKTHLFIEKDGNCQELNNRKRYDREKLRVITSEAYKGQLMFLLSDWTELNSAKIQKMRYATKPIQELIVDYNKSQIGEFYTHSFERALFQWSLNFGFVRQELKAKNLNSIDDPALISDIVKSNFNPSNKIVAGLSLNIVFGRNLRRVSLYNQILYVPTLYTGKYVLSDTETMYSEACTDLDFAYLRIANMFRYRLNNSGVLEPYIMLGFSNNFNVKFDSKRTIRTINNGEESLK